MPLAYEDLRRGKVPSATQRPTRAPVASDASAELAEALAIERHVRECAAGLDEWADVRRVRAGRVCVGPPHSLLGHPVDVTEKDRQNAPRSAREGDLMSSSHAKEDGAREVKAMEDRQAPPIADRTLYADLRVLARLALNLGEVRRATRGPSGRRETVATHTVMLALFALEAAGRRVSSARLDRGLVVAYAVVHDLLEALTGDVSTLRPLSDDAERERNEAERDALRLVREQLAPGSPVVRLVEEYLEQKAPEARWVRHLDKMLPKVVRAESGGAAWGDVTSGEIKRRHDDQRADLAGEFPGLDHLLGLACRDAEFGVMTAEARRGREFVVQGPLEPVDGEDGVFVATVNWRGSSS